MGKLVLFKAGIYLLLFLQGLVCLCCSNYNDVIQRPMMEWSTQESLLILMSCMEHNLFDFHNPIVKVCAIPYYPSVIVASLRVSYNPQHSTDEEFRASAEELARANAGLYIDWIHNAFVDARGNYFRGPLQLDSLMFMIRLDVIGFTREFYYIGDLEQRIYLVNEKNNYIKPRYVWGKHQNVLNSGESLLVMFALRNGEHHFLEGSKSMCLVIKGFDADVKLAYDLAKIR